MKFITAAATVLLLLAPSAARAQSLNLHIENGRVTLRAENVPARAILAEWARVGGTRIVGGERVTGAPLTIQLENVPERQALDVVLRTVSGYMLAPRQAGVGLSSFDRILILPTSTPPRNAGPSPMPSPAMGGNVMAPAMGRTLPVQPQVAPVDENDSEENPQEDVPVEEENEGEGEPSIAPAARPFGRGGAAGQVSPAQGGTPQEGEEESDAPEGDAPGNPFFTPPPGSTQLPGVVTPVPQQPRQPGARPTPPPPPPPPPGAAF